jgi:hypothetical protein
MWEILLHRQMSSIYGATIRASPPNSDKLYFYIKISWCLILNVPTHKHFYKKSLQTMKDPFTPFNLDQ